MYGLFCLCKTTPTKKKHHTTWTITIITKNELNPDMCTILPTVLQSRVSEKNEMSQNAHRNHKFNK